MVLLKQIPKNVKVTFIVCKLQEEALEFMRMAHQQWYWKINNRSTCKGSQECLREHLSIILKIEVEN